MNWYKGTFKIAYQVQTRQGIGELVSSPNDKSLTSYFDYQTDDSYTEISIVPLSLSMGILYPSATYIAIQASKQHDEIDRQVISLLMDRLKGFEDVQWSMGTNPMVDMFNKATGKQYTDDPNQVNMTEIEETEVLPLPQGVSIGYTSDTLKIIWTDPGSAKWRIDSILKTLEQIIQPFIKNDLIDFYSIRSSSYGNKSIKSQRGEDLSTQNKNTENTDVGYLKYVLNTVLSSYPNLFKTYSENINNLYPDIEQQNTQKVDLLQSQIASNIFSDSSLDSEVFKAIISFDENKLAMFENILRISKEKNIETYLETVASWIVNDKNFEILIDDIESGKWLYFNKLFLDNNVQDMLDSVGLGRRASILESAVERSIPQIIEKQDMYLITQKILPIYKQLNLSPEVVGFMQEVEQKVEQQKIERKKQDEERRKADEEAIRKKSFEMDWDHAYVDLNNTGDKFHEIPDKYVEYFGGNNGSDLNLGQFIVYDKDIGVPFDDDDQDAYEKAYDKAYENALEQMQEKPSETYGEDQEDVFYDIEEEFEEFLDEEFFADLEKFDSKHENDENRDQVLIDVIKKDHMERFINWKKDKMQTEEEESGEYDVESWIDNSELNIAVEDIKIEKAEAAAYEYGIMTAKALRANYNAFNNRWDTNEDSVEFTVNSKFLPQAINFIKEFTKTNVKASRSEESNIIFNQNSRVNIYIYDSGEAIRKSAYDILNSGDLTANKHMNWYKQAQKIYDIDDHEVNYLGLGHTDGEWRPEKRDTIEFEDSFLAWVWDGERILTGIEHNREMGFKKDRYAGRYEKNNEEKRVSIVIPRDKQFREIPNVLIKTLNRTFGDDINIYLFNQ